MPSMPPTSVRAGQKQLPTLVRYYTKKIEHPGAFLERYYLKPLGISQSKLANILGVSRRRVNEIVNGQRAITADTAIRLSHCFYTSPMFWLEKQQRWELYVASRSQFAVGNVTKE